MICRLCQKTIDDDADFCPFCGEKVIVRPVKFNDEPAQEEPEELPSYLRNYDEQPSYAEPSYERSYEPEPVKAVEPQPVQQPSNPAPQQPANNQEQKEEKGPVVFHVFAIIGLVLGIFSFVTCWIGYGFYTAIPGLVFSILGKKARPRRKGATVGMVFSIISIVVGFIALIVIGALIASGVIDSSIFPQFSRF